jgi:hypothetical protein
MRLFLALGLTLIIGLGAAFRPGDNLPGREVGAAESGRVVGGQTQFCVMVTCGPTGGCNLNLCYSSGTGRACTVNCQIYGSCTGG